MLKKFKQSSKVWVAAGLFHLQKGALDKAREILQASLKSLPKHKRKWDKTIEGGRLITPY